MMPSTQQEITQLACRELPALLIARGLTPCLREWLLTERAGRQYLFGVLDVPTAIRLHGSLKGYTDGDLLHALQTVLKGTPVVISNTTGLRYCIPLSGRPTLPAQAPYPIDVPRDILPLGLNLSGPVRATPGQFINALVTGAQGSGKSTFLHTLAYTALRQQWVLYLADAEGHTFNPEAWNALAIAPVAETAADLKQLLGDMQGELDRRSALFRAAAAPVPPDNLDEYNRLAAEHHLPRLPYALFLADEANSFFDEKGLAEQLADLARRGRKWGLLMALAAHSWRERDVSRTLSALLPTRVCFRVSDDTTGAVILNSKMAGKQAMGFSQPGRGYLVMNGQRQIFQSHYLPPEQLRAVLTQAHAGQRPSPLSAVEVALVQYAITQLKGAFIINKLAEAARAGQVGNGETITHHRIRKIAENFEQRGWLTVPTNAVDARKVTPELAALVGPAQTGA